MTAHKLTITSGKGGVGKTTATVNIAVALADLGQSVVCIDADIGLRNLDVVMGLENRIVYDLVDVVEGRCRVRQAMIRDKKYDDLYLIPAAQTRDKNAVSPSDMITLVEKLSSEFDWIIIDSPAGIERGFKNAIAPSNEIIVVTNPDISAVRDADRIIGIIESEQKVKLSREHKDYKWVTIEEAKEMVAFSAQRDTLRHINKYFIDRTPSEYLRIELKP